MKRNRIPSLNEIAYEDKNGILRYRDESGMYAAMIDGKSVKQLFGTSEANAKLNFCGSDKWGKNSWEKKQAWKAGGMQVEKRSNRYQ